MDFTISQPTTERISVGIVWPPSASANAGTEKKATTTPSLTMPKTRGYSNEKLAAMDRITTTIKREWLAKIVAGTKKIEYREVKPYWDRRLSGLRPPFAVRLINGMSRDAPEATIVVRRVDVRAGMYRLHIDRVINVKKRQALMDYLRAQENR